MREGWKGGRQKMRKVLISNNVCFMFLTSLMELKIQGIDMNFQEENNFSLLLILFTCFKVYFIFHS